MYRRKNLSLIFSDQNGLFLFHQDENNSNKYATSHVWLSRASQSRFSQSMHSKVLLHAVIKFSPVGNKVVYTCASGYPVSNVIIRRYNCVKANPVLHSRSKLSASKARVQVVQAGATRLFWFIGVVVKK